LLLQEAKLLWGHLATEVAMSDAERHRMKAAECPSAANNPDQIQECEPTSFDRRAVQQKD
jgi:hypothetical protein